MLYGTILDYCTEESCSMMTAGPNYEYHWSDGTAKPIKCSAPKVRYTAKHTRYTATHTRYTATHTRYSVHNITKLHLNVSGNTLKIPHIFSILIY